MEDAPTSTDKTDVVFHEVERLRLSFLGRSHGSAEKIRNFSRWLSTYVADNGDTMTCDEVIIISRISRSLPFFDTFLGDAFARFWETGRENDSTKISEGLLTFNISLGFRN